MVLPDPLPDAYAEAAAQTPIPEWTVAVTQLAEGPSQRYSLNTLTDVQAPYPQLHDLVDESFVALRQRVIDEAGWDVLAAVSEAFVPLTTSLDPGLGQDWLYTGRAFALNPLMSNAGWMVAVRQDYGTQTYWRLYIRTLSQDGTQGKPLHNPPGIWQPVTNSTRSPTSKAENTRRCCPATGWISLRWRASMAGNDCRPCPTGETITAGRASPNLRTPAAWTGTAPCWKSIPRMCW
jgi:hypothetical protein